MLYPADARDHPDHPPGQARTARSWSRRWRTSAAANQATAPGLDGKPVHYLRTLVPITEEALVGYEQRLPSNRHNAYFAPGGLAKLADGGLLASDCRNTTNPQIVPVIGTGAPPCKQQPPWTFGGKTRYFPHVEPRGGG